ncbi:hypothetical protein HanRHA438_Chr04g0197321 [Helianthus annuus]|nr:hypothetical protein HanIR_Chr04g0202081 [Helianthus annuus]KAJ0598561.1 hypothetical protein HanHA89_Chr04g0167191 [Helianthus annuus]KAJ0759159.1 hypothetical protein HanLR1_Chr04g0158401 [Helianthus annuus]KAJ0762812.1 hypothetical protein HanOQP8_Chr04g0165461 [Helianthus annuus]KAJ0928731.1 hypothetical protein HanRHA438_Chr04g0197321 [Helianthus annuus]
MLPSFPSHTKTLYATHTFILDSSQTPLSVTLTSSPMKTASRTVVTGDRRRPFLLQSHLTCADSSPSPTSAPPHLCSSVSPVTGRDGDEGERERGEVRREIGEIKRPTTATSPAMEAAMALVWSDELQSLGLNEVRVVERCHWRCSGSDLVQICVRVFGLTPVTPARYSGGDSGSSGDSVQSRSRLKCESRCNSVQLRLGLTGQTWSTVASSHITVQFDVRYGVMVWFSVSSQTVKLGQFWSTVSQLSGRHKFWVTSVFRTPKLAHSSTLG